MTYPLSATCHPDSVISAYHTQSLTTQWADEKAKPGQKSMSQAASRTDTINLCTCRNCQLCSKVQQLIFWDFTPLIYVNKPSLTILAVIVFLPTPLKFVRRLKMQDGFMLWQYTTDDDTNDDIDARVKFLMKPVRFPATSGASGNVSDQYTSRSNWLSSWTGWCTDVIDYPAYDATIATDWLIDWLMHWLMVPSPEMMLLMLLQWSSWGCYWWMHCWYVTMMLLIMLHMMLMLTLMTDLCYGIVTINGTYHAGGDAEVSAMMLQSYFWWYGWWWCW